MKNKLFWIISLIVALIVSYYTVIKKPVISPQKEVTVLFLEKLLKEILLVGIEMLKVILLINLDRFL